MEVGKRSSEQQRKTREKSVDTKRMQDLERQVSHTNKQTHQSILSHSLPSSVYVSSLLKSLSLFTRWRSWSRYLEAETQTPCLLSSTLQPALVVRRMWTLLRHLHPAGSLLCWKIGFSAWKQSWKTMMRRPNTVWEPWSNGSTVSRYNSIDTTDLPTL